MRDFNGSDGCTWGCRVGLKVLPLLGQAHTGPKSVEVKLCNPSR